MNCYVIVGNGVAANTAAERIRKSDRAGVIRMFSREPYPFYYTPALPEYLAGEKEVQTCIIHDRSWYEKHDIDLHLETEITHVDPGEKRVVTQRGDSYRYDKLLLATGGRCYVPPITGSDCEGVFTLRTLADASALRARALQSKKLIAVGGGLLGLEAGNGLRKTGVDVTVVEVSSRLLPRQVDHTGSAMLREQLEDRGFTFRLGCTTREIVSRTNGKGLCVCLDTGEELYGDMVLISAGVRPEIMLAQRLGLDIDKGVKVDDMMKTGMDDMYAAGDLIEHRGCFYGIWPASMEQGKVAGSNMAGNELIYEGTVHSNSLKVTGIQLFSAGDIDGDETGESIIFRDEAAHIYRKIVITGDRITGALLMGDVHGDRELERAIKEGRNIGSYGSSLSDPAFDFSRLK